MHRPSYASPLSGGMGNMCLAVIRGEVRLAIFILTPTFSSLLTLPGQCADTVVWERKTGQSTRVDLRVTPEIWVRTRLLKLAAGFLPWFSKLSGARDLQIQNWFLVGFPSFIPRARQATSRKCRPLLFTITLAGH